MFVAIYYDTDGFTYGCEHVLGAYETRSEADERCLKYSEDEGIELGDCRVEQLSFGDWEL